MKKKIMLVFGTRPEAIKMAPLLHALKDDADQFEPVVCVTSQHREMLDQVLSIFDIFPDIDLDLMKKNQNLSDLTSLILTQMQKVFIKHQPDIVLVHGDTTTTLATSIAAFYQSIPVGHVEAGLRTYNLKAPFPEEFNRQITGKITKWHFAPTNFSKKNLLSEGISKSSITVTGNTVIDALHWILKRIDQDEDCQKDLKNIGSKVLRNNDEKSSGISTFKMKAMYQEYEKFRSKMGYLPATYEVIYGSAWKKMDNIIEYSK